MIICNICCSEFQEDNNNDVSIFACGHLFHLNCITTWLNNSSTCPTCRQPNYPSSLIKVFFEFNNENELHNELLKNNEKLNSELKEVRDKTNKQEAELLELKVKYRESCEKIKILEKTKNMDDMNIAGLTHIKKESTDEIIKLNYLMKNLKLDVLAERDLRRNYQNTLHKLDPNNESYDIKSITVDESKDTIPLASNDDEKASSSSVPFWLLNNEVKRSGEISKGAVKKDKSYIIPNKIQKMKSDRKSNNQPSKFKFEERPNSQSKYDFNWKTDNSLDNNQKGDQNQLSRLINQNVFNSQNLSPKQSSSSSPPQPQSNNNSITETVAIPSSFNFGNSSTSSFSSLFNFGEPSTSRSSTLALQSPFKHYREMPSDSPRVSDR